MSHRPLGVAILAVLEVISGLLILALGAFIVIGNWSLDEGWRLSGPSGVLSILLLVWAAIFVIIGFLYLAVASGLWNESDWAWILCCVLSTIGVFVGLLLSFLDLQNGIIIMLINIIALVYLMTHSVRAHFGKTSESKKQEPSEESNWDKPSTH